MYITSFHIYLVLIKLTLIFQCTYSTCAMQVLYLCSGDMRNPLYTISKLTEAYPELNVHLCDNSEIVTARNILLSHIMLSDGFDSRKMSDVDYLWDVWYSTRWSETVRQRFIKDLKELVASRWANKSIVVPGQIAVKHLDAVFKCWLNYSNRMTPSIINEILMQRYC